MSIEVMSLVWKNFRRGGSEKLALLALADWCDDKGERLYPSISAIAEKINVSECQARRIVHKFIDEGILRVISNEHGGAPGSTRHYALNISALVNSTRETASTHATPSIDATPSAHATPEQGRRVASMRETASTHATLSVKEQPLRASDKDKDAPPIGSDPVIDRQPSLPAKRKKADNPTFDPAAIELPDWLDPDLWQRWCADKKRRRKPITPDAAKLQIKHLAEYREQGHTPQAVIEHSIASGYQSLYPRSNANANNQSANQPYSVGDRVRAAISKNAREREQRQNLAREWRETDIDGSAMDTPF